MLAANRKIRQCPAPQGNTINSVVVSLRAYSRRVNSICQLFRQKIVSALKGFIETDAVSMNPYIVQKLQIGGCRQTLNGCHSINAFSFRLSILFLLLFQFASFVAPVPVWGQGFEGPPRVIDDADEDAVFSPNGDGVQDNLIISFVTDGFHGDFRITIDVHGPGASGPPDGKFSLDDDWVFPKLNPDTKGRLGPARPGVQPPDDPKVIRQEWDGKDRSPDQGEQPAARTVADGTYQIRVEVDAFQDDTVLVGTLGYQSVILSATIDRKPPKMSGNILRGDFSPNADGIFDTTVIAYTLSEDLKDLQLEFTESSNQPAVTLTGLNNGSNIFIWNGDDGLGTPLRDGLYTLQLRGQDKAGNAGNFTVGSVRIDTEPPVIAQVTRSGDTAEDPNITGLAATFEPGDGSPIYFNSTLMNMTLKDASDKTIAEASGPELSSDTATNTAALLLDDPLDTAQENGVYTLTIAGADRAGNRVQSAYSLTFDTVAPTVTKVSTDAVELKGVDDSTPIILNQQLIYVEATLSDNISEGSDLGASTIRLNRPQGEVLGRQIVGNTASPQFSIRWVLQVPTAVDGSEDGPYTITVNAVDRLGNESTREILFVYDTQAPKLLSLSTSTTDPQLSSTINHSLSQVVATFDDTIGENTGSGIDFEATQLRMVKLGETPDADAVPVEGTSTIDHAAGTLTFKLTTPIQSRDGSQDALYRIEIPLTDRAGNAELFEFEFIYDTQVPALVKTTPNENETVSTLSQVTVLLSDPISGVNFTTTTVRLLRDGVEVAANIRDDGESLITLTLATPLPSNGSADGTYTLEITPADRAGNTGVTVQRTFFLATQIPEIRLNTPADTPTNTLITVDAQLTDYIGLGIDLSAANSTIEVLDPNGAPVPPKSVEANEAESRLLWTIDKPLPRDGSADGEYTARVVFTDRGGQLFSRDFSFTFDTVLPEIVSTTPTAEARVSELDEVIVKFGSDLSGVDLTASAVRLLNPSGAPVGANRVDNGIDTVTLRVGALSSAVAGVWTVEVSPADRAGNRAESPFRIEFTLTPRRATVAVISPALPVVNRLHEITAQLQNYVGPGVNFNAPNTTISVTDPQGTPIAAQSVQPVGDDALKWNALLTLPRDGSADGKYTVSVSFEDTVGVLFRETGTIILDTVSPTIVKPVILSSPQLEYLKLGTGVDLEAGTQVQEDNRLTIALEDNLSGIDFETTAIQLLDFAVNPVPTTRWNDGVGRIFLSFEAFKTDGSVDGIYRIEITPVDLAGNAGGLQTLEFRYATQVPPPRVGSITPANKTQTNSLTQINVKLEDVSGAGIDFSLNGSSVEVRDPNNLLVEGVITHNAVDELTWTVKIPFRTDGADDGAYTITVNPIDLLGNRGLTRQFTVTYDTQDPVIQSVTGVDMTANVSNFGELIMRVEALMTDSGVGIDFDASSVQLFKVGGASLPRPVGEASLPRLLVAGGKDHDNTAKVWWQLQTPLKRSGEDDGLYTIVVNAVDKAGNARDMTFQVRYDTQAPTVRTIQAVAVAIALGNDAGQGRGEPAENEEDGGGDGTTIDISTGPVPSLIGRPIHQLRIALSDEAGSGVDLTNTTVALIGPNGAPVGTTPQDDGVQTVFLSFNPLRADGTDDGRYTIRVTPTDLAGNTFTSPIEFQFFYGTQNPEVLSVTPAEFAYVSELTTVSASLLDHSGEGIDLDRSTIRLHAPDGGLVNGRQHRAAQQGDENTGAIVWELNSPPPRDGSADGRYTIRLSIFDRVGNQLQTEKSFVYDTQIPKVARVIANTTPVTVLPTDGFVQVDEPFTQLTITLGDADGSGVDFSGTTVQLLAPDSEALGFNSRDDGDKLMTVNFAPLRTTGTYTLEITPRDLAGNASGHPIAYKFNLILSRPRVAEVIIGGHTAPVAFINKLDEIKATLVDANGAGDLDLTPDGSTITITGPSGPVDGEQQAHGTSEIIWHPIQIPTDGTADGEYTVTVTPRDLVGGTGVVARHQFTLDTQAPEVVALSPSPLTAPVAYIGEGLTQITAHVADPTPASAQSPSGLKIAEGKIELRDSEGTLVPANVTDDNNETLFLTLTQPLSTDGGADGEYTVTLYLTDQAGNQLELAKSFVYDTQIPKVVSVEADTAPVTVLPPDGLVQIAESFTQITATLDDAKSEIPKSGVDFGGTTLQLLAPGGDALGLNSSDDGDTVLTVSFAPLREIGTYTLEITPRDLAGNTSGHPIAYKFNLNLPRPRVVAVSIGGHTAPVAFINKLDEIKATLVDANGAGDLDLTPDGSTVTITGPSGPVDGEAEASGTSEIVWRPIQIPTDGSADGKYTVTVTPRDLTGQTGEITRYQFTLDTQVPQVVALSPSALTAPVAYIGEQLTQVTAQVTDPIPASAQSPAGLQLAEQKIELRNSQAALVPATATHDKDGNLFLTLTQPLSTDGSADGEYTLTVQLTDQADNQFELSKSFVYDTQIPKVVSVEASTTPATVLPPDGLVQVDETFTQLTITLQDALPQDITKNIPTSGVDFGGTTLQLLAPGGDTLGFNPRDDGDKHITVSFAPLREIGTYTLEITPRDRAGNTSGHPIAYKFNLNLPRPRVAEVIIGGQPAPVDFVNQLHEISAKLVDESGAGLDLTPDGSTITVTGPSGPVDGESEATGALEIVFRPTRIPADGTADGLYTITVTPRDFVGRTGVLARHQVTLDTQTPQVTAVSPITLSQPVSYIGEQITLITAHVADPTPASSQGLPAGLQLADQSIELRNNSGTLVPADLTYDNSGTLFLTLAQPLATDGGSDGQYTVIINLTDRANNRDRIEHPIVYDTQAPTLVSTTPTDGAQIRDDLTSVTATLNDQGGSGIDFTVSQLILFDPAGATISGVLSNDGRNRFTLRTDILETDGRYTIRVVAIDRAGNGANSPFERSFLFSTSFPAVVKTVPTTTPAEEAFTNVRVDQVEVEFESNPNLSTVTLLGPNNTTVTGRQDRSGNRLTYILARPLSQDGVYMIQVIPTNSAGRRGEPELFTFTYDSVPPEVNLEAIKLTVQEPDVNNALIAVEVTVTDPQPGSGLDWEGLDDTWLTLDRVSTKRQIRGTLSSDGGETLTLRLRTPLASDGGQDGKYKVTITPKDRAGNVAEETVYQFIYDTRPPVIAVDSLRIDDQPLIVDTNHVDYPSAGGIGDGVVIGARLSDIGLDDGIPVLGVDLARSLISVRGPDGGPISGILTQDGTDGILFKSGPLTLEGLYQVTITSVGLDSENLGFTPAATVTTQFLYETTKPTAQLTDFGGETNLTDKAMPLFGTADDPESGESPEGGRIPSSGVALVEIVGTGPGGTPIEPLPATDESTADTQPWSRWSLDFLPSRSGEYDLDIRVTDRAGNITIVDGVTATFSVSLVFKGPTYIWPNPLRSSNGDLAHFSFDLNVPGEVSVKITLSIYDFAGDLVFQKIFPNVRPGRDSDQLVTWNLKNGDGTGAKVARGVYIFRLEALDTASNNLTNAVGKILVVE